MTFTLFIPTINEIDGMRAVMPKINPAWFNQILVVDGGSNDGTVEYAREQGYEVFIQSKRGIHYAYTEAWPLIRSDAVVTFSPDGNCRPEDIPALVARMKEGYDMVVASRYFQGVKSEDDDAMTGFGNWMFTRLINLLHGGHYSDAMGIFRAYRTSLFYELDLHKEDGYLPEKWFGAIGGLEPLLSVRAAKRKLKISEVLGFEPKRVGGERKLLPFRWGCVFLCQVLREVVCWR